ncbi:MAG: hypothetical protein ACU0DW_03600 [Shimia sp.]
MTDNSPHIKDKPAKGEDKTATDEAKGKPMRGHPDGHKEPIQGLFVEDDDKRGE